MADPVQLEWLNENSLRAYPFRENMLRRPYDNGSDLKSDALALPNCILVDFCATVPYGQALEIYLHKFSIVRKMMTFVFAIGESDVISVSVDGNVHRPYSSYRFSGTDVLESVSGTISVGDISGIENTFPDGLYIYSPDETMLEARCTRPSLRSVESLSVYENSAVGYVTRKIFGDVKLMAGSNIQLRYDRDHNAIWIDAADGLGYREECDCGDISRKVVHTINGISTSNVKIVGDECINVEANNGVIKITDICSKPCCGCAELTFINQKINQLQTGVSRLENYADMLNTRLTEFISNYSVSYLATR